MNNEARQNGQTQNEPRTEAFAVTSFVTGLVSFPLFCCCGWLGLPLNIVAVVFGVLAISKCNKEPQRWKGKGLAIAGIVLGSLGIVLLILVIGLGVGAAVLGNILQSMGVNPPIK